MLILGWDQRSWSLNCMHIKHATKQFNKHLIYKLTLDFLHCLSSFSVKHLIDIMLVNRHESGENKLWCILCTTVQSKQFGIDMLLG